MVMKYKIVKILTKIKKYFGSFKKENIDFLYTNIKSLDEKNIVFKKGTICYIDGSNDQEKNVLLNTLKNQLNVEVIEVNLETNLKKLFYEQKNNPLIFNLKNNRIKEILKFSKIQKNAIFIVSDNSFKSKNVRYSMSLEKNFGHHLLNVYDYSKNKPRTLIKVKYKKNMIE